MKAYKHVLVAILFLLGAGVLTQITIKGNFIHFVWITFLLFFLFNSIVRSKISFKPYFLSKWNFFSAKYRKDIEFDIPIELVFDKLLEVFSEKPFKLRYANKDTFEIFSTTGYSWKSWGENIYIQLVMLDDNTIIKFNSVSLFGIYTRGKNEENFEGVLQKIEDSLTV